MFFAISIGSLVAFVMVLWRLIRNRRRHPYWKLAKKPRWLRRAIQDLSGNPTYQELTNRCSILMLQFAL